MRWLPTLLAAPVLGLGLALPAMAEQMVKLRPASFVYSTDPGQKLCIAQDHVLSARKAGIDIAFVMDARQHVDLVISPDGYDRSARLGKPVWFSFADSLRITAQAALQGGSYRVALQDRGQPSDLWIALRRQPYTVVTLPKKPDDRFGIDLATMPQVFARLQACQQGFLR